MGFRTFNPSQNSWNPEVYSVTSEEELASKLADMEASQDLFSQTSPAERARFLRLIASEMDLHKSNIQAKYCQESGLSEGRFLVEWKRTLDTLELFAQYLETHYVFEKIEFLANESIRIRKKRLAIGPVLVMGSSNFPLAYSTIGGDSVAAFAAGCCVLVKAHPMHVGTSTHVATCIEKALELANLPQGIFTHIVDDGITLAQKIVSDERIQAVGFTGSFRGGKAMMDLAQQRKCPIPVFAEMGSCNPMIVFNGLNSNESRNFAEKISQAICNDAGQFCTKPGLLFIPTGIDGDQFVAQLSAAVSEKKPVPMLHPSIFENYQRRKKAVMEQSSVKILVESTTFHGIEGPITLAETSLDKFQATPYMQEEVFGPFALVIRYTSEEQLKSVLRSLPGQLTASLIYPLESKEITSFVQLLCQKAGRLILNGVPTGVRVLEVMHHGGPYPASSDLRFTAVGPDSIHRFQKDVSIQEENIA